MTYQYRGSRAAYDRKPATWSQPHTWDQPPGRSDHFNAGSGEGKGS